MVKNRRGRGATSPAERTAERLRRAAARQLNTREERAATELGNIFETFVYNVLHEIARQVAKGKSVGDAFESAAKNMPLPEGVTGLPHPEQNSLNQIAGLISGMFLAVVYHLADDMKHGLTIVETCEHKRLFLKKMVDQQAGIRFERAIRTRDAAEAARKAGGSG